MPDDRSLQGAAPVASASDGRVADGPGALATRASARVFQPADVRSLRDVAYDDIRDAILSGALQPGQRVKERDVAAQMGISTTPVKEALRRLEQEGLVVSQPRRGAVVSGLATIPVEEIEEIRGALEAIAARLAATRLTDAELARLEDLVADMAALTRDMREPQRRVQDVSAFHQLILAGSRNDFIPRFVATLAPFERLHQSEYLDPAEAQAIQSRPRGDPRGTARARRRRGRAGDARALRPWAGLLANGR